MERKVLQESSALLLTMASSARQALPLGSPLLKIINASAADGSLALRLWDRCFVSSFSQTLCLLQVAELVSSALPHHWL